MFKETEVFGRLVDMLIRYLVILVSIFSNSVKEPITYMVNAMHCVILNVLQG